jgi:hypothetical protein
MLTRKLYGTVVAKVHDALAAYNWLSFLVLGKFWQEPQESVSWQRGGFLARVVVFNQRAIL